MQPCGCRMRLRLGALVRPMWLTQYPTIRRSGTRVSPFAVSPGATLTAMFPVELTRTRSDLARPPRWPFGRRWRDAAFFALIVVCGQPVAAQNVLSKALQDRVQENPHTTEADVEAGAKVFRRSCSLCHGADGTGGDGPDLTRGVFRHGSSDAALFRNILTGIPNSGMGGIYQPDKSIWQVVSYVRSLSRAGGEEEVPGDPRRGGMLYRSRGSCSDCHRLNGSGGRLGPDLSDLGWRRAPDHIRASIVEPAESIDGGYRTVEVRTESGAIVRGVLRNEDRFSIQLFDEFENLRSFQKTDLAAIDKPEESLMPPLGSFFRGRDLDDLVAYLYSLRPE